MIILSGESVVLTWSCNESFASLLMRLSLDLWRSDRRECICFLLGVFWGTKSTCEQHIHNITNVNQKYQYIMNIMTNFFLSATSYPISCVSGEKQQSIVVSVGSSRTGATGVQICSPISHGA